MDLGEIIDCCWCIIVLLINWSNLLRLFASVNVLVIIIKMSGVGITTRFIQKMF